MSINVNGPLKLSRIAVRALLGANKTGVILLITSLAGYQGAFSAPLYCATKHAIVGFVRSMAALDDMESIKVVAVAPGYVYPSILFPSLLSSSPITIHTHKLNPLPPPEW